MPLHDFECMSCHQIMENVLIRNAEELKDLACPQCGHTYLQKLLSLIGGYNGDTGSGSTKPRNAGSFKRSNR